MDNTSSQVIGVETALQQILGYYINALVVAGESDPKRYIATKIGEMISLSEAQMNFVMISVDKESSNINNCFEMLINLITQVKNNIDGPNKDCLDTALGFSSKLYELFKEAKSLYEVEEIKDDK